MPKMVHDAVDIRKMLPDKTADARVVRNDLKAAVSGLITSGWATHAAVINKWLCHMRNLGLKNKGNITVKDWNELVQPWANWCFAAHPEVTETWSGSGFDCERAMVITNEEVEERKAGSTSETFCKLLDERQTAAFLIVT